MNPALDQSIVPAGWRSIRIHPYRAGVEPRQRSVAFVACHRHAYDEVGDAADLGVGGTAEDLDRAKVFARGSTSGCRCRRSRRRSPDRGLDAFAVGPAEREQPGVAEIDSQAVANAEPSCDIAAPHRGRLLRVH
jgi:hypothetical protein